MMSRPRAYDTDGYAAYDIARPVYTHDDAARADDTCQEKKYDTCFAVVKIHSHGNGECERRVP